MNVGPRPIKLRRTYSTWRACAVASGARRVLGPTMFKGGQDCSSKEMKNEGRFELNSWPDTDKEDNQILENIRYNGQIVRRSQ